MTRVRTIKVTNIDIRGIWSRRFCSLERTMRVKADLLSYRQVSGKSVGGS
ncbi:hypothetical protein HPP92_028330 [Vanilla planifolia]|uniref:Uncharacterized protein n=1 Tax=Vanilla planifolia TaxID=51239 RepID=A0A835PBE9_VANPL|nr:hypothetical protein HPP92_028330 [Vanilla planifolia]